jgi:hypothetical protein
VSIDQSIRSGTLSDAALAPLAFDLATFGSALRTGDLGYQLACYAADAEIRIVSDARPAPLVVSGTCSIWSWLLESAAPHAGCLVPHLVDGGDRIAFTQRWRTTDGTKAVLISTAELQDGLITTQHTIVVCGRRAEAGLTDGWAPAGLAAPVRRTEDGLRQDAKARPWRSHTA